jgi:septation ring formation regulator EzrA
MSSNPQQQHLLLVLKDCCETKKKLSKASKELLETKNELSEMKKEFSETKKELSEAKKGVSVAKDWLSQLNKEQLEAKGTLTMAVQLLSQGKAEDKETIGFVITCSSSLKNIGDCMEVVMPKFSEYRRSGKVWHSSPFYYGEGYKMCLAVYANGVGVGAGTHACMSLLQFCCLGRR